MWNTSNPPSTSPGSGCARYWTTRTFSPLVSPAAARRSSPARRIARDLNLRLTSVERYARDLRRLGHLPARQTKRDQVATLHAAGLDRHAIARTLNMTPQSVSARLHEVRRAGQLPRVARATRP